MKAGKNLKPLTKHVKLGKLPTVVEPNQEMELDFAGPLPLTWGTKKYILVGVDRFSKLPSAQITYSTSAKSIKNFLRKITSFHGITRTIRTDQGSGFISKEVREFCQEQNINVTFSPVGDHRATGLVEQLFRTFEERLLVMAQESPKPSLEIAFLKLIKCSRTLTQQSLNCSPVKARLDQHDWGKWSEKFQLTIIAKDSVDIEDLINPPGRPELIYPTAEWKLQSSNPVGPRKRTSKPALQSYNEEVRRRKAEDNAKFNGLRIGYIDKKLKSQLYLALGREGQK